MCEVSQPTLVPRIDKITTNTAKNTAKYTYTGARKIFQTLPNGSITTQMQDVGIPNKQGRW